MPTALNKTAKLINPDLPDFNGEAHLYRLNVPIEFETYSGTKGSTHHVVVSAINAFDTCRDETYIFPADDKGEVISWAELDGSERGIWDHEQALENAGYTVI